MLSIVIPTFRGSQNTLRLLQSIKAQVLSPENYEVIIVTNSQASYSEDELCVLHGACASLQVVHSKLSGANISRNFGASLAKGELLLFLDDDCELLSPSFFTDLLSTFKAKPGIDALGGGYRSANRASATCMAYNIISTAWADSLRMCADKSMVLLGGNFAIRKNVFQDCHGFVENVKSVGEEIGLCKTLVEKEYKIYFSSQFDLVHHFCGNLNLLIKKAEIYSTGDRYHLPFHFWFAVIATMKSWVTHKEKSSITKWMISLGLIFVYAFYLKGYSLLKLLKPRNYSKNLRS